MKRLIVSIHDVHPGSFHGVSKQVEFCRSLGVSRFSILLVPDFHKLGPFERSAELVKWLRVQEDSGSEIVLHGQFHMGDVRHSQVRHWFWNWIYTENEAEFLALDFASAYHRIRHGVNRLRDAGLHPFGFIAPAWLANTEVERAIFQTGLLYTNTVNEIVFASGSAIRSRSMCYSARSLLRRAGSPMWNSFLWRLQKGNSCLRLSLHPTDLELDSFRRSVAGILRDAVALEYETTTYRDVALSRVE